MLAEHALAPCVHLQLRVRRKTLFFQDTRRPWFANKFETPKIALKEWRAPFAVVLSTRCHLKLMRAVSSPDNKARPGFCVPKGAGDALGAARAPSPLLAGSQSTEWGQPGPGKGLKKPKPACATGCVRHSPSFCQLEKYRSFPSSPDTLSCGTRCIGALLPP